MEPAIQRRNQHREEMELAAEAARRETAAQEAAMSPEQRDLQEKRSSQQGWTFTPKNSKEEL